MVRIDALSSYSAVQSNAISTGIDLSRPVNHISAIPHSGVDVTIVITPKSNYATTSMVKRDLLVYSIIRKFGSSNQHLSKMLEFLLVAPISWRKSVVSMVQLG